MTERGRAGVATGALLVATAVALAGWLLRAPSLAATAVQAAMVEWASSRLGVPWTRDPEKNGGARARRRALRGLALGLAAAGAFYGLGTSTGAIVAVFPTITGALLLVPTLGDAIATAVRDEMLLHGVLVRLVSPDRAGARVGALVACGLASAAWAVGAAGDAGLPMARVVFELLAGVALGALWLRDDSSAWVPVAAHAGWRFATRGATFAVAASTGWGGGSGGPLAGGCAVAVAGAAAALGASAVVVARRRPR